jgi:hypothetical protein
MREDSVVRYLDTTKLLNFMKDAVDINIVIVQNTHTHTHTYIEIKRESRVNTEICHIRNE